MLTVDAAYRERWEAALAAESLANDLYIAVVNPDLTWWDDLTPEMQAGWLRGAALIEQARQQGWDAALAAVRSIWTFLDTPSGEMAYAAKRTLALLDRLASEGPRHD